MNISNNFTTPAFKGFYVHDEKMNKKQQILSDNIVDAITYCDEYVAADEKNIDVYITPNHKQRNAVNVRYMDLDNGYYFRNGKKIIQTTVAPGSPMAVVTDIIKQLKDISSGEYGFRGFDAFSHQNKSSDLLKLRPDFYKDMED